MEGADDDAPQRRQRARREGPRSRASQRRRRRPGRPVPAPKPLLKELWDTGIWHLLLVLLLGMTPTAMLLPYLPSLLTDYFASKASGTPLQCESFPLGHEPPDCFNAHGTTAEWQGWTLFVSQSILSFVINPLVGSVSDRHGRKPFLLLAQLINLVPPLVLLLYYHAGVSLLWFFPGTAFAQGFSVFAVGLPYAADVTSKENRPKVFGLVLAVEAVSYLIGPIIAGVIGSTRGAIHVAFAFMLCAVTAAALLRESLPAASRQAARQSNQGSLTLHVLASTPHAPGLRTSAWRWSEFGSEWPRRGDGSSRVRDAAQDHEDLPLLLEESESSGADSRVYLDEASEEEEDGSTQGRRSRHHGRRTARAWGDWMAYGVHGTNARGHAALPWAGTGGALAFGGDARGWFRTGPGAGARRRGPEAGDDDDDWVFGRTGEGREEGQSDPGVRLHSPFSAPERLWHGEEGSRGRGGGGRDASGREGGEAVGADEVADSYRRGRSRRNSKAHAEGDSDASGPTRRVSGRDTRSTTGGADGAGVAAGETAARDAAPPSNGRRAGGWHARPEGAGGAPPASVFPSAAPRMGAAGDGGDLFKDPAPTHARGKSPDARVVLDVPPLVRPKPRVDVEWGGLEPGTHGDPPVVVEPVGASPLAASAGASAPAEAPASDSANIMGSIRIAVRSPLFRMLTLLVMLQGASLEGLDDLILQYLQMRVGFGPRDQSMVLVIMGACGIFNQIVLLPFITRYTSEQPVLILGLLGSAVYLAILSATTTRVVAFSGLVVMSLTALCVPAISSIKSRNAAESEQGAVQGALFGAQAIATGIGPVFFATLFSEFTRSDRPRFVPLLPGAPFMLGSALMSFAVIVACLLPKGAHSKRPEPAQE